MNYCRMQISNILIIFMKCYFLFHQNFDKLLCNLLLSLNPRSFSFLPCNNIYLDPLLCLLNHCLLLAKPIYPLAGLLIAKLHKTRKKIGGKKFDLVVCLLHMKHVKCAVCVHNNLQEFL